MKKQTTRQEFIYTPIRTTSERRQGEREEELAKRRNAASIRKEKKNARVI